MKRFVFDVASYAGLLVSFSCSRSGMGCIVVNPSLGKGPAATAGTNQQEFRLAILEPITNRCHVNTLACGLCVEILIPTGELAPVAGTPFDFLEPTAIGARIDADNEQLKLARGYDQNWVLEGDGKKVIVAAEAYEPTTGRVLEVLTDQPGIQFYTGNFLDGSVTGTDGKVYKKRYAFCLETQHYPDSPNHPKFPTTELKPGQTFRSTTVYRFSAR